MSRRRASIRFGFNPTFLLRGKFDAFADLCAENRTAALKGEFYSTFIATFQRLFSALLVCDSNMCSIVRTHTACAKVRIDRPE